MSFPDRIKALRINKDLTQKELGKLINVSEQSVKCWENGSKNPSMSAIISLSKVFNVSCDYILGQDDSIVLIEALTPLNQDEQRLIRYYRMLDEYGKSTVSTLCSLEKARVQEESQSRQEIERVDNSANKYIPLYDVPAAAGNSVPLDGESFKSIPVDSHIPTGADFAVRIQGNSMSPYFNDHDIVYVSKNPELSIGDIGIFSVDGAMYCKQYLVDSSGNLSLISLNPELKHTNIYVDADSTSSVKCYGKVITQGHIDIPLYFTQQNQ